VEPGPNALGFPFFCLVDLRTDDVEAPVFEPPVSNFALYPLPWLFPFGYSQSCRNLDCVH